MSCKTIFVPQEGPANALALNKDFTQVVIAGRNVFKVFSIDNDEFNEVCNLRVGKNLNLNFSSIDVAWSTIEENTLATAATNGAVVVWNLGRSGRSKQEHVFFDHKRTVNKVSFHLTEPAWLISGSQDGMMKCFDLRMKEVARTFFSNTESVRDVQFSPHAQHTFAAVSENGNVQLWDIRKAEKCFHQFTAHSGPVFACDWHPESPWLATASRDKTIKVWDVHGKPSLEYTIHTIASVGHVKWRPQRKYHIASCALVLDSNVNVWDVRRPYIPFATFSEHKDVTTAVAWKGDPDIFLSTSRDCTLYRHMFKDATHPAMSANPQGISLSVKGEIVYACKQNVPTAGEKYQSFISRRQTVLQADTFHVASSVIRRWAGPPRHAFIECARGYLLSGQPLSALCDHNARVARDAGKFQIGLVWSIIKTLYASKASSPSQDPNTSNNQINQNRSDDQSNAGLSNAGSGTNLVNFSSRTIGTLGGSESGSGEGTTLLNADQRSVRSELQSTAHSNIVDDDSEGEDGGSEHQFHNSGVLGFPTHNIHIPKGNLNEKITEIDGKRHWLTARHAHYFDASAQDWTLQGEAFTPRAALTNPPHMQDVQSTNSSSFVDPEHSLDCPDGPSGITFVASVSNDINGQNLHGVKNDSSANLSSHHGDYSTSPQSANITTVEDQPSSILTVTSLPVMPLWDPTITVVDTLRVHAEMGDVQTSVSVLLVLGDLRNSLSAYLDEVTQEHWLVGYLDLLARHKLWDVCTLVIQGAWISNIAQLNQQSTIIHTSCGSCGKQLARVGWLCDKCNSSEPGLCSVCHQVVKGLYAWCQGCSHGGHLEHMRSWMAEHKQCPAGCGHLCEYS
ncbi:WD repeat domain 24 [Arctopsyche grandis]|uniref:WD repeat domain 24 n=1 Tax=Arctopsyche grandis TaxID=121162 RepID=UPI00406D8FD4